MKGIILARVVGRRWQSSLVGTYDVDKTPITARLWAIRKAALEKEAHLLKTGSNGAEPVLLEKTTAQSRVEIRYNFASEPKLKDLYIDARGDILMGKIFEDLDSLAGTVAFIHCQDDDAHTLPPQLVTASCEAITLERAISARDIIMVGQVCWVGRSSLDVVVEIHEAQPDSALDLASVSASPVLVAPTPSRVVSSIFTYVSRSRDTGKAALVNKLLVGGATHPPSSPSSSSSSTSTSSAPSPELVLWQQREALAQSRKNPTPAHSPALPAAAPDPASAAASASALLSLGRVAHDMPALSPPHSVLMQATALENVCICQPQNTNTSGRVFGGFLMHRAFDLAEACGYMFAGAVPTLRRVDKILFKRPVDIGDLIRLKARIVASTGTDGGGGAGGDGEVVCEVTVQIVKPAAQTSVVSNTFSFVFGLPAGTPLKRVLPLSQEEAEVLVAAMQRLGQ